MDTTTIVRILRARRYTYRNEVELHDRLETVLTNHGIVPGREVRLDSHDRIDFLLADGLGIEVKVDGRAGDVRRQLERYATHPTVTGLLLVTTRARHAAGLPTQLGGKPFTVLVLRGGI